MDRGFLWCVTGVGLSEPSSSSASDPASSSLNISGKRGSSRKPVGMLRRIWVQHRPACLGTSGFFLGRSRLGRRDVEILA